MKAFPPLGNKIFLNILSKRLMTFIYRSTSNSSNNNNTNRKMKNIFHSKFEKSIICIRVKLKASKISTINLSIKYFNSIRMARDSKYKKEREKKFYNKCLILFNDRIIVGTQSIRCWRDSSTFVNEFSLSQH